MTDEQHFYWDRFSGPDGWLSDKRPNPADLAALRSGLGRDAGTVPAMWRHHHFELADTASTHGWADARYAAEHHALTLYAVHQQSKEAPMHRPGIGLGKAVRALHSQRSDGRDDGQSSAVDRRFYAAVTAGSVREVAHHLRGLVQLLRSLERPVPLDYSHLVKDLTAWADPARRDHVRLRWGKDYESRTAASVDDTSDDVNSTAP